MNKIDFLEYQTKKAVELIRDGKKVQLEFDAKNGIYKIFEITTKRIKMEGKK